MRLTLIQMEKGSMGVEEGVVRNGMRMERVYFKGHVVVVIVRK
jgi:hypothetical protein